MYIYIYIYIYISVAILARVLLRCLGLGNVQFTIILAFSMASSLLSLVSYRKLASRVGFAIREARKTLERDDVVIKDLKVTLSVLGGITRPKNDSQPAETLAQGPSQALPLAELLAKLATSMRAPAGSGYTSSTPSSTPRSTNSTADSTIPESTKATLPSLQALRPHTIPEDQPGKHVICLDSLIPPSPRLDKPSDVGDSSSEYLARLNEKMAASIRHAEDELHRTQQLLNLVNRRCKEKNNENRNLHSQRQRARQKADRLQVALGISEVARKAAEHLFSCRPSAAPVDHPEENDAFTQRSTPATAVRAPASYQNSIQATTEAIRILDSHGIGNPAHTTTEDRATQEFAISGEDTGSESDNSASPFFTSFYTFFANDMWIWTGLPVTDAEVTSLSSKDYLSVIISGISSRPQLNGTVAVPTGHSSSKSRWIAAPLLDDLLKSAFYPTGYDGDSASGSEDDAFYISIIYDWIDQNEGERILLRSANLQRFDITKWLWSIHGDFETPSQLPGSKENSG